MTETEELARLDDRTSPPPGAAALEHVLSELLDGEPDEDLEAAAGTHLATCDSCRVVVEDTRQVRRASRRYGRLRLPDEARNRIREALIRDE